MEIFKEDIEVFLEITDPVEEFYLSVFLETCIFRVMRSMYVIL